MNKIISILIIFILSLNISHALQVTQPDQNQNSGVVQDTGGSFKEVLADVNWELISSITIITVLIVIVFGIIFWIIWKIYKKINEDKRTKDNTEFVKYESDIKMCKINSDKRYMRRTWWSFFLFTKRAAIYCKTDYGRKFIGYYLGESTKKEGFFIFGIEQRYGFFNRETDVVIMPYKFMKKTFLKNDDFTLDLIAEGIDEVMSSEYYSIPVFNNPNKAKEDKDFIDFSSFITEKYFKTYIERDATKEMIKNYRENIKEASEMNSNIILDRKTSSQLRE